MKITNFEATDLNVLDADIKQLYDGSSIDEKLFKELAVPYNVAFVIERVNRLITMLLVELKDSYVQQSQRYVAVEKKNFDRPNIKKEDLVTYDRLVNRGMELYSQMSELKVDKIKGRPKLDDYKWGIPFEDARYILPISALSNISITMNATKLWDMFELFNSQLYGNLFTELKKQLLDQLPQYLKTVLEVVPGKRYNTKLNDAYEKYFSQIFVENPVVKFNSFTHPSIRVGIGALTSTQEKTTTEVIEGYGDDLPEKATAVANRVISYGHTGVTEQTRHTFGLMMSICAYHQQARHRLYNAQREPLTNLVNTEDRVACVPSTIQNSPFVKDFNDYYAEVRAFRKYLNDYYGPEVAYLLILNCDMIKQVVSSNARIECDIMKDRLCQTAQWEIRHIYEKKFDMLAQSAPVLYKRAIPPCVTGVCKEGKLTCGKANEMKEKYGKYL